MDFNIFLCFDGFYTSMENQHVRNLIVDTTKASIWSIHFGLPYEDIYQSMEWLGTTLGLYNPRVIYRFVYSHRFLRWWALWTRNVIFPQFSRLLWVWKHSFWIHFLAFSAAMYQTYRSSKRDMLKPVRWVSAQTLALFFFIFRYPVFSGLLSFGGLCRLPLPSSGFMRIYIIYMYKLSSLSFLHVYRFLGRQCILHPSHPALLHVMINHWKALNQKLNLENIDTLYTSIINIYISTSKLHIRLKLSSSIIIQSSISPPPTPTPICTSISPPSPSPKSRKNHPPTIPSIPLNHPPSPTIPQPQPPPNHLPWSHPHPPSHPPQPAPCVPWAPRPPQRPRSACRPTPRPRPAPATSPGAARPRCRRRRSPAPADLETVKEGQKEQGEMLGLWWFHVGLYDFNRFYIVVCQILWFLEGINVV